MQPNFTLDRLASILFPWRKAQLIEQAAGEVARECQPEVWRLVCRQIGSFSIAEIRGYVRGGREIASRPRSIWSFPGGICNFRFGPGCWRWRSTN